MFYGADATRKCCIRNYCICFNCCGRRHCSICGRDIQSKINRVVIPFKVTPEVSTTHVPPRTPASARTTTTSDYDYTLPRGNTTPKGNTGSHVFLACRSRQASIVLERYFRFEVSLLSFYACERDGPI